MSQQVHFQNEQWRVTDENLESVDSRSDYVILLAEIPKTRQVGNALFYDWPLQMAEKSWVDMGAFIEAFHFALKRETHDEAMLAATIAKAQDKG